MPPSVQQPVLDNVETQPLDEGLMAATAAAFSLAVPEESLPKTADETPLDQDLEARYCC